jgi:hypothetical protein
MWFNKHENPMARRWITTVIALSISGLVAAGTSCSSGPQPPQPGTPAFYWAAAKETYRAGDFVKTSENLQRILSLSDNEFSARARAWDTVISSGLTQGYMELADAWEAGARANRLNPTPFRKQVSALRSLASASAIQFTEDIHKVVEADKDPKILLAFAFPAGAPAVPVGLKRMTGGILVQDAERDLLQAAMLQRGVLLSICAAVGSQDDAAAAQQKLIAGDFLASRDAFLLAAARSLSDASELFTGTKLDLPNRLKMLSQEALKVLAAIPQTKETKAVGDKIQARLKKAHLTI